MIQPNIDKLEKEFFKKSLSVGHHNVKYCWKQIMLFILHCIRGLESIEEGAGSPSAQTVRDRLALDGEWLGVFHEGMWDVARWAVRLFKWLAWYVSIDETHLPFFGNRKKLNMELSARGLGACVHGYRADTPGATGSFCLLVISLCCCRIRIPVAIKMVIVGEKYQQWLESHLKRLRKLAPHATLLADRGFGNATWFYQMMDRLKAKYVVRIPLRKKEHKNKVACGVRRFLHWMKDSDTKETVLLTIHVTIDSQDRQYVLASNIEGKTGKQLLRTYLNRWDLENIFKDADRAELPTSSRNPTMRLYCVVVSFLLFTLWQVSKRRKTGTSLRRFIKQLINALCIFLNCIISPVGTIVTKPPP